MWHASTSCPSSRSPATATWRGSRIVAAMSLALELTEQRDFLRLLEVRVLAASAHEDRKLRRCPARQGAFAASPAPPPREGRRRAGRRARSPTTPSLGLSRPGARLALGPHTVGEALSFRGPESGVTGQRFASDGRTPSKTQKQACACGVDSVHPEACNASGACDGVIHSGNSYEVTCFRTSISINATCTMFCGGAGVSPQSERCEDVRPMCGDLLSDKRPKPIVS